LKRVWYKIHAWECKEVFSGKSVVWCSDSKGLDAMEDDLSKADWIYDPAGNERKLRNLKNYSTTVKVQKYSISM